MKLDYIFKKYQDHHWVEEEASASNHIMDPWRICYLDWVNIFKNKNLYSFCFFLLDKNHLYEWSSYEESERVLAWLLNTYSKNKKYLGTKGKEYEKVGKKIDDLFHFFREADINKFSNQQIKDYIVELMDVGNVSFGYNLLAESMDIVDENYYRSLLPNVANNKLLDIVSILSTPNKLSFLEKEHLDLLKLARKHFKKQTDFFVDMENHQHDYFWIQNNYKEAKIIKTDYFLESFNEIIKKKKLRDIKREINYLENKKKILDKKRKVIYKKYKLSKKSRDFFTLVRLLADWQDRRKESVQKILSAVDKMFFVVSRRYKLNKVVLREYFIDELSNLLLYGKKVSKSDLKKRENIFFYSYLDKRGKIKKEVFYGPQIFRAKEYFQRRNNLGNDGNLKGFVASKGRGGSIIEGRARIVLHAKGAKFNFGEILVTGMTRPEFVPLMKKAKAIITNEGGITTHAAIISRELKIPCIIGTKVATEVFKTGDKIRVDLKQGIIKKLK